MFEKEFEEELKNETDAELISEAEYNALVADFDLLWNRTTTPQEQLRMEGMIRLINAFEDNQNRRRQN